MRFQIFLCAMASMALAGGAPATDQVGGSFTVHAFGSGVTSGHEGHQCSVVSSEDAQAFMERMAEIDAKPLPRPEVAGSPNRFTQASRQRGSAAGLVPEDYVSPVELVRDEGHVRHEIDVRIDGVSDRSRLEQVLSFDAPSWSRLMLVEFIPDDPAEEQGNAGLFLRPNNPFVGGEFPMTPDSPSDMAELQVSAYGQAAYRSANRLEDGLTQYVLVTRDMDPAPAGKSWHVAIGQMRDDREVNGTLRVTFSGSTYRAPLAIQLFYNAEEEDQKIGFFDETPREPNGDNPGKTQGEAMRWILFKAAEELLEDLDFDGFLPVRVLVSTMDYSSVRLGFAGGFNSASVSSVTPAPGRIRARPAGAPHMFRGKRQSKNYSVPLVAFERETGTDACRAGVDNSVTGYCDEKSGIPNDEVLFQPGQGSSAITHITVMRDYELTSGPNAGEMWRWDKNWKDMTGRPNIVSLIKHELMHALGFSSPIKSQAYVAAFDPPRPYLNSPFRMDEDQEAAWTKTGTRQHFYGPIASTSEHNPWRHTAEPGPRLQDDPFGSSHLMFQDGDELASWEPGKDFMRQSQRVKTPQDEVGIARDILLDVGYARKTWSIQDRRLPRHWYDPDRSGHGIDFRRVERDDGSMQHFLHFYSYDDEGNPEWYIATAELSDRMVFESTLDYVTWDDSRSPAFEVDPARSGTVRLELDPAIDQPACEDRRGYDPDGNETWLVAVLEFDLPDGSGTWCLEPLKFGREPAFPQEGSGSWYAADPEDSGWGLSVMTRNYGPRPIINTVVYYYDNDGDPTWAIGTEGAGYDLPYGAIGNGVEIDMQHVTGFCRTCEPDDLNTDPAGTLQIQINSQSTDPDPNNQVMLLDLNDQGPIGGNWQRENVGIQLLSGPHPDMSQ